MPILYMEQEKHSNIKEQILLHLFGAQFDLGA